MIDLKKCPYCAEEIHDGAIKCRHCGSHLAATARPNKSKDESNRLAQGLGIIIVAAVIIFIGVRLSGGSNESAKPSYIATGEHGYLNTDTYAAITTEDSDLFTQFSIANNIDGMRGMVNSGQVFAIERGSEVDIVDEKFNGIVKIKYRSRTGWVPIEFVSKK